MRVSDPIPNSHMTYSPTHQLIRGIAAVLACAATSLDAQTYTATAIAPLKQGAGINDSGLIVGIDGNGNGMSAGSSTGNGLVTSLGTLGGASSTAVAINSSGTITGSSLTSAGLTHAFSFSAGTMSDLGTLGGSSSVAFAINSSGMITGYSEPGSTSNNHAFIYGAGAMTDIGVLPDFVWVCGLKAASGEGWETFGITA